MTKRTALLATLLCVTRLFVAVGQSPASKAPAFEVASIKQHVYPPGVFAIRMKRDAPTAPLVQKGSQYQVRSVTLRDLMIDAYAVYDYQIVGLPGWAIPGSGEDSYDITAKAEGDAPPTSDQLRGMLQTLLSDRFQLQLHRETKEFPVYDLSIDKNGSKLKLATDDTPKTVQKGPIGALIKTLLLFMDRPVVDKTGLTETYELGLPIQEYVGQEKPPPSIFSDLQKQFGLKLTATKGSMEVLVVDHAAKPTPN